MIQRLSRKRQAFDRKWWIELSYLLVLGSFSAWAYSTHKAIWWWVYLVAACAAWFIIETTWFLTRD